LGTASIKEGGGSCFRIESHDLIKLNL